MYTNYRVTVERDVQTTFKCDECGAHGQVRFRAVGRSGRAPGRLFGIKDDQVVADASMAATQDIKTDMGKVLLLIACKTCGRRQGRAGSAIRVALLALATGTLAILSGGKGDTALLAYLFAVLTLIQIFNEHGRFLRASAAVFATFKQGTIPKKAKTAAPSLPIARTVTAPTSRPVTIPAKVPTIAPPSVMLEALPPARADGEPRVLF